MIHIAPCSPERAQEMLPELCALLQDAVASGASIGFLPPLAPEAAQGYWHSVLQALRAGERVLLLAERDGALAGTAQLDLCQRQNGSHRAEVMKVMVHTATRRQGIGRALMLAIEDQARALGRPTLVLDTRAGDSSEHLYASVGWIKAGEIPRYARNERGGLDATALYYRLL
jgi:GNAT superfamily N-acetyltransferase